MRDIVRHARTIKLLYLYNISDIINMPSILNVKGGAGYEVFRTSEKCGEET